MRLSVTSPSCSLRILLLHGAQKRIAEGIRELIVQTSEVQSKSRARRSSTKKSAVQNKKSPSSPELKLEYSQARQEPLRAMEDALKDRSLLPTAAEIRKVYLDTGGKSELPKTRKAAINHLLHHFNGLSDSSFKSAFDALKAHGPVLDATGDYQRWFQLIRRP
jgi:hypothetical protein